jgi:DNA polymerase III epsilon subunit family exonuclease
MLIALDLETTGFNPKKDRIIEVGLVKFENGKIIEKFSSLINPHTKLSSAIKAITNISDEDLNNAPDFDEIRPKIEDFIKDFPIVGHNIHFDINFLNHNGLNLTNPEYDTLPISLILLPHQPSYSLEILSDKLNLEHTNKHRALDDSIASMHLFNYLTEKIREIDEETGKEIKFYLKKTDWPLANFVLTNISLTPKKLLKEVDIENKPIYKLNLSNEEKKLSEKITQTFEKHKNLLCETGLGINRQIAYLKSAIDSSNKEKTIISINHKTSICHSCAGRNPFILKSPENFLCKAKFDFFKQKSFFTDSEMVFLIKLINWLKTTKNFFV